MKPGTYVGKDRRTYQWHKNAGGRWDLQELDEDGSPQYAQIVGVIPADWPAAKAALDALVEEEGGQWVKIPSGSDKREYRIRRDGGQPQYHRYPENTPGDPWHDEEAYCGEVHWANAYRKGREVALEGVRELLEAVWDIPHDSWGCRAAEWRNRVVLAARALEVTE